MKPFPKDCSELLAHLTEEIKTAPPDRAQAIIHQVGYLFILAGYGQAAYESLSHLLQGKLRLSPSSALMYSLKENALPYLCYSLNFACPAIADREAMSGEELAIFVRDQEQQSRQMMLLDPYFLTESEINVCPSSLWTNEELQQMLGLSDEKPSELEIYDFLQDVHRVIQAYCRNNQWHVDFYYKPDAVKASTDAVAEFFNK